LNCGGHAFATEGHLLGPILEEFKQRKIIDPIGTRVNGEALGQKAFLSIHWLKSPFKVEWELLREHDF
jgi:hypothetical protein